MGMLCSTVGVQDSTVVYEENFNIAANAVGVEDSAVGRNALLNYVVSGNTTGIRGQHWGCQGPLWV